MAWSVGQQVTHREYGDGEVTRSRPTSIVDDVVIASITIKAKSTEYSSTQPYLEEDGWTAKS